jgi:hypothetical protein
MVDASLGMPPYAQASAEYGVTCRIRSKANATNPSKRAKSADELSLNYYKMPQMHVGT